MKTNFVSKLIATGVLLATFCAPALAQGRAVSPGTRGESALASSGAGTAPAVATAGAPDAVARINGQLHYIHEGKATRITGQFRLIEGLTVESNGDIILKDGRKVKLTEGRMVSIAGEQLDVPRNIEVPQPISQPASGATNRVKEGAR